MLNSTFGLLESRTLTSAWIETFATPAGRNPARVALSRVRGLKLLGYSQSFS